MTERLRVQHDRVQMNRHNEDHELLGSAEIAEVIGSLATDDSATEFVRGGTLNKVLQAEDSVPIVVLHVKERLEWLRRHRILGALVQPFVVDKGEDSRLNGNPTLTYTTPGGSVKLIHIIDAGDSEKGTMHKTARARSIAAVVGPLVHTANGERADGATIFVPRELFDVESLAGLGEGLGNTAAEPTQKLLSEVQKYRKAQEGHVSLLDEHGELVDEIAGVRRGVRSLGLVADGGTLIDDIAEGIAAMERGDEIARAKAITRMVSELAPNILTTSAYVRLITRIVDELNQLDTAEEFLLKMEVIGPNGDPLTTEGMSFDRYPMGLITAVHSGSTQDGPYFVRVKYRPGGADEEYQQTVRRFIGKGMMFDDGGRFPKPFPGGLKMKADMQGSATELGAMVAAIRSGANVPMDFCYCIQSNENGAHARRNGDVMIDAGGDICEEGHTDAEGREALRDGLLMSAKLIEAEGDELGQACTVATLTGAAIGTAGGETIFIARDQEMVHDVAMRSGKLGETASSLAARQSDIDAMKGKHGEWVNKPATGVFRGSQQGYAFIHRDNESGLHADTAGNIYQLPEHPKDVKHHELSAGEGVAGLLGVIEMWAEEEASA